MPTRWLILVVALLSLIPFWPEKAEAVATNGNIVVSDGAIPTAGAKVSVTMISGQTINGTTDNNGRIVGGAPIDPDQISEINVETNDGKTRRRRGGGYILDSNGALALDIRNWAVVGVAAAATAASTASTWGGTHLFDITLFGGVGRTVSDPMARSTQIGMNQAESGVGNLTGGKFGGKIRMHLPESLIVVPNFWLFFGGEKFFDREGTGGRGSFHPTLGDDTSTKIFLEYALDFGVGYTIPCPGEFNCSFGVSAGASLVGMGVEGRTNESGGGGEDNLFEDWRKQVAPFLGAWVYQPIFRVRDLPVSLVVGADFRYLPSVTLFGQSKILNNDYEFQTQGFWDADYYVGLNVPIDTRICWF